MNKKESLVAGLIFIGIGIYATINGVQYAPLLILIGLGISGDIRKFIWEGIKFLWNSTRGKEVKQEMKQTTGSKQQNVDQKSKRDSIFINIDKYFGNKDEKRKEKEHILDSVHQKMSRAVNLLNDSANLGLKRRNEIERINGAITNFRNAIDENEIKLNRIDENVVEELKEVLGCLRKSATELKNKKSGEKIIGTVSNEFLIKYKELKKKFKELN